MIETRPPTILVVEDDADLRDNLGMLFSDAGFRVLPAEGAREAMALLAEADATVVLADSFLGDGTGLDVLRAARRRRRAARCVLMTAFGADHVQPDEVRREGFEFIRKPFEAEQILELVQALAR